MTADSPLALVLWGLGGAFVAVALFFVWAAISEAIRDAGGDQPSSRGHTGARGLLPGRAPRTFAQWHRRLRAQMRRAERDLDRYYRGGHLR